MMEENTTFEVEGTYSGRISVYFEKRYDSPKYIFQVIGNKIVQQLVNSPPP